MILNQGFIVKRKSEQRQIEPFEMRLVNAKELNQVIDLQHHVYERLPNKEVLYMDTKAEMLEDLYNGALIIGVFNKQDRLISYRYVSFPGYEQRNLGRDIHLNSQDLHKVVHLETTLVHPDYRGNRLQSLTLNKAVELIEDMDMRHLICTVSPYNLFSLYNIMSAGLNIKALKKKYGKAEDDGLWRFILHKDLKKEQNVNLSDVVLLKMDHLKEQRKLIDSGYIGYHLSKESQIIQYAHIQ